MDNCIFCKIVNGEIPSFKIFENENTLVFMDIFPAHKGHCLIVPKEHSESILSISEKSVADILVVGKKIAKAIQKALNPDGMNFLQNNGSTAGQEVPHYHMHIVPRYEGEGPGGAKYVFHSDSFKYEPSKEEIGEIADLIKAEL